MGGFSPRRACGRGGTYSLREVSLSGSRKMSGPPTKSVLAVGSIATGVELAVLGVSTVVDVTILAMRVSLLQIWVSMCLQLSKTDTSCVDSIASSKRLPINGDPRVDIRAAEFTYLGRRASDFASVGEAGAVTDRRERRGVCSGVLLHVTRTMCEGWGLVVKKVEG